MFEVLTEIVSNRRLTENTWHMALRSAQIAQAAKPGQFVMIRVRTGLDPLLRRPFSICGVSDDLFLLLYRVVGKGTSLMTELREGDRTWVLGPLGKALPCRPSMTAAFWLEEGSALPPSFFWINSTGRRDSLSDGISFSQDIISREDHGKDPGVSWSPRMTGPTVPSRTCDRPARRTAP